MTSASLRGIAYLIGAVALSASCGSGAPSDPKTTASGGSGGETGRGGDGGHGGSAAATLSFPQLVHGAVRVDTDAFATIPIIVTAGGALPDAIELRVDDVAVPAEKEADRFVALVDAKALAAGPHTLTAEAKGSAVATGSLVVGSGSFQLTKFANDGPAYNGHLVHDAVNDALVLTWISAPGPKHTFSMARLDGAFARLGADVTLNDPGDEPLSGYAAFGKDAIGVVYRTPKPGDTHWLVKMRVVDPNGGEIAPAMDLTAGGASFSMAQAGVDPGGFSAAWLHITPAADPSNPPPVEVRFARWDRAAKKLVGPITLDSDQPPPSGSVEGPQRLAPLGEIGLSCNDSICLVTYSRDLYDDLVALNVPKLFVAAVDLASGQLRGAPTPVAGKDWDTQMFGHHLITLADGSFALVYTSNDTAAAVFPETPCDETLERDLLRAVRFDAAGKIIGKPQVIFDEEGTRQFPRIAAHPAGFAMLWEDQRSICGAGGHIRMAANVVGSDLTGLLDPYLELPNSIGLPPEDPTLAAVGTGFFMAWSDNRHGGGLANPRPEIHLDTYFRR